MPKPQGWRKESYRHGLSARRIKTRACGNDVTCAAGKKLSAAEKDAEWKRLLEPGREEEIVERFIKLHKPALYGKQGFVVIDAGRYDSDLDPVDNALANGGNNMHRLSYYLGKNGLNSSFDDRTDKLIVGRKDVMKITKRLLKSMDRYS